ncbi:MAG: GPW/gp25 family protein [Bacteroidota bacterium]
MSEKSFLGRGWAFPPTFDLQNKEVTMVEAEVDIDQSLNILLSTSLGERVMQPDFGCNMSDFQFEAMNASLLGYLRDVVETAILYYEPRIRVEQITITEGDSFDAISGKLIISVDYFIRETNSRFNFVYDFYIKEGVPIQ